MAIPLPDTIDSPLSICSDMVVIGPATPSTGRRVPQNGRSLRASIDQAQHLSIDDTATLWPNIEHTGYLSDTRTACITRCMWYVVILLSPVWTSLWILGWYPKNAILLFLLLCILIPHVLLLLFCNRALLIVLTVKFRTWFMLLQSAGLAFGIGSYFNWNWLGVSLFMYNLFVSVILSYIDAWPVNMRQLRFLFFIVMILYYSFIASGLFTGILWREDHVYWFTLSWIVHERIEVEMNMFIFSRALMLILFNINSLYLVIRDPDAFVTLQATIKLNTNH
jgi:hypothetical protein